MFKAGSSNDRNNYTFRFPKEHPRYFYFRSNGTSTGKSESIDRKVANIGHFAMSIPRKITLNNRESGKTFLMGNPFMTHINVAKLMEANSEIEEIRVCSGSSYNKDATIESQTVSSKDNPNLLVAPMEAFFVVTKSETKSLEITLNENMLMQKHKITRKSRR